MSCEHKWTEDKYTPADDKTCVRCCESKREALENCVEAMDSADYFRSLAIRNAAIDRAREALKGGGR